MGSTRIGYTLVVSGRCTGGTIGTDSLVVTAKQARRARLPKRTLATAALRWRAGAFTVRLRAKEEAQRSDDAGIRSVTLAEAMGELTYAVLMLLRIAERQLALAGAFRDAAEVAHVRRNLQRTILGSHRDATV